MKLRYILTLGIIFLSWIHPAIIFAQEQIIEFEAEAVIGEDRSVEVTETIVYDFGENQRRGIYRVIPGQGVRKFELLEILRNGEEAVYTLDSERPLQVTIFEEDVFYTGTQEYTIRYRMVDVVRYFSRKNLDEFSWNITGTDWEVPMNQVVATIKFPDEVDRSSLQIACYQGENDADNQCDSNQEDNQVMVDVSNLGLGEGVTLAIGFAPGTLVSPSWFQQYQHQIDRLLAVIVALVGILSAWKLWQSVGNGSRVRKPIVRQYTPLAGVIPAAVGYTKKGYYQPQQLSATLIDLARRGYLTIEEKSRRFRSTEYIFHQVKSSDETLHSVEKFLLESLFSGRSEVSVSDLQKEDFSQKTRALADKIYQDISNDYMIKPTDLFGIMVAAIALWAVIAFIIGAVSSGALLLTSLACLVGVVSMGIALFRSSPLTPQGAENKGYVLGFEYYLKHAEERRLEFQEQEKIFFEILPHAIALGVVDKWAKAFKEVSLSQPDWYQGNISTFSAVAFANSIQSTSTAFVTASGGSSSSMSGGGGSVGGGVGGGGGGSV